VLRAVRTPWANVRILVWTLLAAGTVSRQLRRTGITTIAVPVAPKVGAARASTVDAVLRAARITCLRRSLVIQQFLFDNGESVDLLIGTTVPSKGFRAHAWLDRPVEGRQGDGFHVVLAVPPGRGFTGSIPGGLR
jgi:hypothetical protein